MNKIVIMFALAFGILFLNACEKHPEEKYDYHVHINKPGTEDKKVGESIHLHIDFESHTEEKVHHVNVRIFNKETKAEIYNEPSDAHVHADGEYPHHDDFVLSADNGVEGHTDWVLEAKVWAHEDGEAEVVETLEFHVHPE